MIFWLFMRLRESNLWFHRTNLITMIHSLYISIMPVFWFYGAKKKKSECHHLMVVLLGSYSDFFQPLGIIYKYRPKCCFKSTTINQKWWIILLLSIVVRDDLSLKTISFISNSKVEKKISLLGFEIFQDGVCTEKLPKLL